MHIIYWLQRDVCMLWERGWSLCVLLYAGGESELMVLRTALLSRVWDVELKKFPEVLAVVLFFHGHAYYTMQIINLASFLTTAELSIH